jgi:hypothetical protein
MDDIEPCGCRIKKSGFTRVSVVYILKLLNCNSTCMSQKKYVGREAIVDCFPI